jgi:predicted N-acetyltransferase YhbS
MKMRDMLVRLYDLPSFFPVQSEVEEKHDIKIRRFSILEKKQALLWCKTNFAGWERELEVAFSQHPATAFGAFRGKEILGFAAYDCTNINFFGPTGVVESERGKKLGKALLLASLHAMKENGFAYAIIGGVGPVEFYRKNVDAVIIEKSNPGIYACVL